MCINTVFGSIETVLCQEQSSIYFQLNLTYHHFPSSSPKKSEKKELKKGNCQKIYRLKRSQKRETTAKVMIFFSHRNEKLTNF